MLILALINKSTASNALTSEFHIGDTVYFAVDESSRIIKGTVVKVGFVNNKENGKSHFQYTIEDQDNHELYEVPSENVSDTLDHLLDKKGLRRFDCEVFLDRCSSLFETVIAETLEDAIASLKEKYPNAYTIRETDPWR